MRPTLKNRSLFMRVFIGFAIVAGLIWTALVIWTVLSALSEGELEARQGMEDYANQILSVARIFVDQPERLSIAMAEVESIENRSLMEDDDIAHESSSMRIQLWLGDSIISQHTDVPDTRPLKQGAGDIQINDDTWWSYTHVDKPSNLTVRLLLNETVAAITSSQAVFLFLPLVFSIPVLLIVAWIMVRRGLRPLTGVVEEIAQRTETARLDPLTSSGYRELDTVVDATNSLMTRLDGQIERERELVADIAHEIKTPLAVMQTNVDLVTSSTNPSTRNTAKADLLAGLTRCNHLLLQLLNLARMDGGSDTHLTQSKIDVAEFLRERVALLEPVARKNVVELSVCAPPSQILTLDPNCLGAIIDNLVDNAIKYAGKGANVQVNMTQGQDGIRLIVKDDGPGIATDLIDSVFDRFKRGHITGDGAGLGLAIVKRACERLGATITLSKDPQLGGLHTSVSIPVTE